MTQTDTTNDFTNFISQSGFYKPFKDNTNKVDFMRYCNTNLSYGYNTKNKQFYLCKSPTLESVILSIISTHNSLEELKDAFFNYKQQII